MDMSEVIRLYCKNDVKTTKWIIMWALPNNKRKMMGLPLKRCTNLRKCSKKGKMS